MTAGNKVYRIDLERQKAFVIFEYAEDASAQIACLKFQDPESTEEMGRILGVGINTSNGGVIAELKLSVAGDANDAYIYRNEEAKLGKIVDISFNYE